MNSRHDNEIVYLTANDLYNINEDVTQGLPWVRDRHLLLSAVRRPRISLYGQPQFPSMMDKAAALMHSLAYHHLFADGNKRTALRAVTLFLEANHLQPTWDDAEARDFVLLVAQGARDVDSISAWLAEHSCPAT